MRRAVAIVAFVALLSSAPPARAAYVWQDDRDANGLACFNVGTLQINNMSGGGVRCVETDNAGNLFPAACSAGGGVSSVTGTATRVSATPTTGAVVIDTIGGYSTGAVTGGNVSMGALASGVNEQITTAGVASPLTYQCVAGDVQFGAASGGGLAQSSALFFDGSRFGVGTAGAPSATGHFKVSSTTVDAIIYAENTASGTGDYAELGLVNNLGAASRTSLYMTSSAYTGPGGANALIVANAGGPMAFQGQGPTSFGMFITKNGAGVPGDIQIPRLNAGGMTKSLVTSGQLAVAVAGTDYQAPLTACTNYVSLSCVSGTTDLGGTNATPTVIGVENGAQVRGKVNIAFSAAPSLPASGQTCWSDSANQVLECIDSLSNRSVVPLIFGCGGSHWVNSLAATGVTSCTQPAFTDLSGSASCAQLPAFTGAITSPGGSCATSYAGLPTASQVMISAGPAAIPVGDSTHTFDRVVHVQAAGNAVGVNGVSVPTSVNLCVGHTTATDRDRSQFFLGGGSLGPTGAGVDSTLFDVIPSNTTINLGVGVLGGIYATQRIHSLSYPGGGIGCAVSVAASLYIDAAPTLVVAAGPTYAIYAASGAAHVAGAIDSGSTVSGHSVIATGTAGTAFSANGDTGPTLGFFGASPLGQQTGGAAVAGGTYTATEAAMINRMYAAMRAYGLLN